MPRRSAASLFVLLPCRSSPRAAIDVVTAALPLLIWELHRKDYEKHVMAWFIAGIFVLLSIPVSIGEVFLHLSHFTNPKLQRYVIRLILMAPIYSATSWLALRFKEASIYLDTARDFYEAFAIYSFTFFLIACLGEEDDINNALSRRYGGVVAAIAVVDCRWSVRSDAIAVLAGRL